MPVPEPNCNCKRMVNLVAAVESGVMMIIGTYCREKMWEKQEKQLEKLVPEEKNQIVIALGMINLETNVTFGVTIRLGVIPKIKKTAEKQKCKLEKLQKENPCACKVDTAKKHLCKWGYPDKWCYTLSNTCGPNGKSNWNNCQDDSTPSSGGAVMNVVPTLEVRQPTVGSIGHIGMTQIIQWNLSFSNNENFIMSLDIIEDDGKSKSITLRKPNSGSTRYKLQYNFGNIIKIHQ